MAPPRPPFRLTRRHFLGFVGSAVAAGALLASSRRALAGEGTGHPFVETPSDDEGPFYRAGAPLRSDLRRADSPNAPMTIRGVVRDEDGATLSGVTLDLWHADGGGAYDNDSKEFRYRGKVTTGKDGTYRFDTDFPGQYRMGRASRPHHVHVKLSGEGLYPLTTQMYFRVRAGVDVPSELVPEMTWSGEGKARAGTGVWNVFLARRPKEP
jgi:protocatechuate 3,4-dioxygenase beta subunit